MHKGESTLCFQAVARSSSNEVYYMLQSQCIVQRGWIKNGVSILIQNSWAVWVDIMPHGLGFACQLHCSFGKTIWGTSWVTLPMKPQSFNTISKRCCKDSVMIMRCSGLMVIGAIWASRQTEDDRSIICFFRFGCRSGVNEYAVLVWASFNYDSVFVWFIGNIWQALIISYWQFCSN